jgi:hypothetical protein
MNEGDIYYKIKNDKSIKYIEKQNKEDLTQFYTLKYLKEKLSNSKITSKG